MIVGLPCIAQSSNEAKEAIAAAFKNSATDQPATEREGDGSGGRGRRVSVGDGSGSPPQPSVVIIGGGGPSASTPRSPAPAGRRMESQLALAVCVSVWGMWCAGGGGSEPLESCDSDRVVCPLPSSLESMEPTAFTSTPAPFSLPGAPGAPVGPPDGDRGLLQRLPCGYPSGHDPLPQEH